MHADLLLLLVVLYPNVAYNCKADIILLLAISYSKLCVNIHSHEYQLEQLTLHYQLFNK